MLAGIFGSAANFVLAAIFVLAEIFVFCLFCCFTSQVNNYGHGGRSAHLTTPFLGKLEEAVNQYFVIGAQWLSGRVFGRVWPRLRASPASLRCALEQDALILV